MTERSGVRGWVLAALACAAGAGCAATDRGNPAAEYDPVTGRLRRLAVDVTRNGRNETVSYMDGTRIGHIEIDFDENGRTDRWDFYESGRRLESIGFSRANDGVMDVRAFYDRGAKVDRIALSTRRDGRFNRTEFYEAGLLVRSEEDTDGNGRPDRWDTYRPNPGASVNEPPYSITSVAFDESGRGVPQRRVAIE